VTEREIRFLPNRELRRVPRGWQHPLDANGRPIPLLPEQMPEPGTEADLVLYETASEGTPLSPVFPDSAAGRLVLVEFAAEQLTTFAGHRTSAEGWAAILFGEGASVTPHGVVVA